MQQNNNLEDKIAEIETDIKNMDQINMSFGKLVEKYNTVNDKLTKCQTTLKTYYDQLQTQQDLSTSEESQENNNLNEDIFMSLIDELNQLKQNITNHTRIDDLMKLYMNAQERIKLCDKYLHKQKMEIIKLGQ